MNVTHITVEYPTQLRVVLNTEAEMRAKGYKNYKGDMTKTINVNLPQTVIIRKTSRAVQEMYMDVQDWNEEQKKLCLAQTGMTPSAYQAKFKKAWNS